MSHPCWSFHIDQETLLCCCLGPCDWLDTQGLSREMVTWGRGKRREKQYKIWENSLPRTQEKSRSTYQNLTSNQVHKPTLEYHVLELETLTHNQKIPEPAPKNQFLLRRASSVRRQHSSSPKGLRVVTAFVLFQGYRTGSSSWSPFAHIIPPKLTNLDL